MATTNLIEVYEGNSVTINCTVTGLTSLDGYTSTITVVDPSDPDTPIIEEEGVNVDLIATFTITASSNDLEPLDYGYEVNVDDGTHVYTIVQDIYRVLSSYKN